MNKIIKLSTLLVVFVCSTTLLAQRITEGKHNISDYPELQYTTNIPVYPLVKADKAIPEKVDYKDCLIPTSAMEPRDFSSISMRKAPQKATPPTAFYMAPEGTLFTGVDCYGMFAWFGRAGVVGSWGRNVKMWKWRNMSTNASGAKYTYRNYTVNRIGELDSMYRVDAEGNLIDSFQPSMKTNIDYVYAYNIPMQVVETDAGRDTFMMFSEPSARLDTLIGTGTTFAGCPCPMNSPDGMWPLTNAQMSTMDNGAFAGFLYDENIAKKLANYYWGSKPIEGKQIAKISTFFEKPMTPLYVKNITLALNAEKYMTNGESGKKKKEWFDYCRPSFDSLIITVYDARTNSVIARSVALGTDSSCLYKSEEALSDSDGGFYPWILTFKFEQLDSVYGDVLEEGITLTDSFRVELSNIHSGQNFGIHTGFGEPGYVRNTVTLADGSKGDLKLWTILEPYIMLNGMYTELYDAEVDSLDHIDLRMEFLTDAYYGVYMEKSNEKWSLPGFFSTNYPIDTISNHFNCIYEAPDWAEIDFDKTYFDDYGLVSFYLTCDKDADVIPQVGDSIKLTIGGKTLVYTIKLVNRTGTAVENVSTTDNASIHSFGEVWQVNYSNGYKRLEVFAANGQMVLSQDLTEVGQVTLSTESLNQGEYLIRLTGINQPTTLRIIK